VAYRLAHWVALLIVRPRTDLEALLVEVGAVKLGDLRIQRNDEDEYQGSKSLRSSTTVRKATEDDDSDWD
jgi:hypothetical protein